jgi:hypothetical protein
LFLPGHHAQSTQISGIKIAQVINQQTALSPLKMQGNTLAGDHHARSNKPAPSAFYGLFGGEG